ncbi:hypothetical protein D3P07_18075 [Paenibacillus sp. 1011MAR3C5]|uniref:hypothetical protein n=1 Tax=Paenibacillus sp. 1011MAR3C5 TaxID=1675787 RepID=UPI000E6C5540|nr:hypothetical protein [Paenibacillus sp. 1011MAR3C5]RJE86001.1 hypothetical protein D3P07_18075 [Paenibacillus sp. 1011MAR3C5]
MWKLLWIGLFGAAIMLGGCAREASDKAQTYHNDGYLGYTNTNPNLLNRSGTLYEKDIQFMGELLEPLKGIRKTEVAFNGDDANVTLRVERGLSDAERNRIRAEAQNILQSNFPRYDVHVKVRS